MHWVSRYWVLGLLGAGGAQVLGVLGVLSGCSSHAQMEMLFSVSSGFK